MFTLPWKDFNSNVDENFQEEKEENWGKSLGLVREYLRDLELNIGRNMYGKIHSGEVSDGNEDMLFDSEGSTPLLQSGNDLAHLGLCPSVCGR